MRIAFIEGTVARTFGSTRRIVELSNSLKAAGHDVTVYTKNGQQPAWIPLFAPVKLWKEINGTYDLALFNNSKPDELRLVRKTDAKVRAFYILGWGETRLDDIEQHIKGGSPDPGIRVIRSVFDDLDFLVLACSTWIGEHLRERYRKDAEILLGGINREHFKAHPKPKDPSSGGTLRIYYSGDPRNRKGTEIVKKAISNVHFSRRHAALIRRTYWGEGLSQEQMGRWYSEATIFADGQLWAGWNNPVLEAMACKTPVVCTDIGGVRDFARDGETALLVSPKDYKAMANALMKLVKSPKLRHDLAENAYEGVSQFTWEKTAKRLVELVEGRL